MMRTLTLRPRMPHALIAGQPDFRRDELHAMVRAYGPEVAWEQAVARSGAAAAALDAIGPFAVGLRPEPGRVVLAVDRFAIETLCYRIDGDNLRFAQRADELVDGRPQIDPQAIFDYLYFHCIPSPRTIFRGVKRLPPAHFLEFNRGQALVGKYWTPDFTLPCGEVGFDALKTEFRKLLRDAVAVRLGGGTPACFLSGGTDSSTVTGMIREATQQAPHTYSIGFEAEGYDEMVYARIAARHFGAVHHEYYVTPDDLVREIPRVASTYDQPFGNSSALPAYCCAARAREDGVSSILAGDGGDELFGGNSRYAKQRLFDAYGQLPPFIRTAVLEPLFHNEVAAGLPLLSKCASYVQQARVPMPDRSQYYNLLLRLGPPEVLTPGFMAAVDMSAPLAQQRAVHGASRTGSALNRMLAFDWRYTLAESDLPKVSGTTRLAGIQARYPMLDERLVEFSQRLPPHYKLRGGTLRWFFKEALRGFLPDEILAKKKQGFGLPFGVWLTRHRALEQLARDSLSSFATRGVVQEKFLLRLLDERVAQHPAYFGEMVWIIMMLEQWLRHHAPDWKLPR
jgi:asparagine synthase (glutamine-hydrolysing)